jgi:ABC-2 type transport system permease protein
MGVSSHPASSSSPRPGYAWTLVRLRWSLTFAALRTSLLHKITFVAGIVLALAAIAGAAIFGTMIGTAPAQMVGNTPASRVMAGLSVYLGTLISAVAFVSQISVFGDSSAFSQRRMGLFGVPERPMLAGLLLSTLAGIPEIAFAAALAAVWLGGARSVGTPVFAMIALPAAVVAVAVWVFLSRALLSLMELLARSKAGMTVLTILLCAGFIAFYFWIAANAEDAPGGSAVVLDMRLNNVLSWLPVGAALQLPFDLAAGAWMDVLGRIVVIAVSLAVCWQIGLVSLRHQRFEVQERQKEQVVKGLGVFARVPDTPRGAVRGRLLVAWRRDPHYLSTLILPVILLLFIGVDAWMGGEMMGMWVAPVLVAMVVPANEANSFAYDGPALATQIESGVPGRDDRAGRVLTSLIVGLALTLVSIAVAWGFNIGRHPDGLDGRDGTKIQFLLAVGCVVILLVNYGVAAACAPVLPYPVASKDDALHSPRGRVGAQIGIPLLEFAVLIGWLLPTEITVAVLIGTGTILSLWWVAVAVGLLNGIAALAAGIVWGGRLYDRHALKLLGKINSFAAIEQ